MEILAFGLTKLLTLLVVLDPPALVPVLTSLTAKKDIRARRAVMKRTVLVAFGIALFFLFVGRATLAYLGVSVDAFSISGGILLFLSSLPMILFGTVSSLSDPSADMDNDSARDMAVFPFAMPLFCGPATITTLLLLASQASGSGLKMLALLVAVVLAFIVSWITFMLGDQILRFMGGRGVNVATRIVGIFLSALAVQFVINGITGYCHHELIRPIDPAR
jgi:multiple antibiotic resistance protein